MILCLYSYVRFSLVFFVCYASLIKQMKSFSIFFLCYEVMEELLGP